MEKIILIFLIAVLICGVVVVISFVRESSKRNDAIKIYHESLIPKVGDVTYCKGIRFECNDIKSGAITISDETIGIIFTNEKIE